MEDYILRVIKADNPWLSSPDDLEKWSATYLPAKFIARQTTLKPDQRICLVVGPRQAGKSTLIWKYLSETRKPFLFINCEEPALREWLTSPALVREDIRRMVEPPVPLFFEEVQRLPEAGLFLKGLVDRHMGVPIFATGSSSFDLESKTRESLAGRAVRHLVLPLSLAEMTQSLDMPQILKADMINDQVQKLLCFGGYPEVVLSSEPEKELAGLVESFIIRDASDRFQVRFPAAFRKLLELASSEIGNLCNFSEWSAQAGISNDTVSGYANLLQETHIIKLLKPFAGGKRAEIISTPKVYFMDNGIRNLVFGGFQPANNRPDRGALWENFAFTESYKSLNPFIDHVGYWRSKSKAEVDFVIQRQGRIMACEIKSGHLRGKITRASRSFIDAYQPELFLMVSHDTHPSISIGKTEVRFIRLFELALTIKAWAEE